MAPDFAPRIIGKIRLPAPKNSPKSIEATKVYCFPVSFVFIRFSFVIFVKF